MGFAEERVNLFESSFFYSFCGLRGGSLRLLI